MEKMLVSLEQLVSLPLNFVRKKRCKVSMLNSIFSMSSIIGSANNKL